MTPSQARQYGDFTGSVDDPWGAVTRQEMVKMLRLSMRILTPKPVWNPLAPWPI
jgi:hypothetical protein